MNVTDQLPKIDIFITDDRVTTVLKEMPMPVMAKVVGHGVARQEAPHEFREALGATSQEEVSMIGH
jgi:hypothetical protein